MNLLARSSRLRLLGLAVLAITGLSMVVACGDSDKEAEAPKGTPVPRLSGSITIDGSSTVFPITEAVAEEFRKKQPDVKVTVGLSGTGGGFQKFCAGETSISDASRPITATEQTACAAKSIDYIEIPVAYDGLAVVVNPQNTWASCMTVAELKKLWEPAAQGNVTKWNQIRDAWPNETIKLYGPGTDSGTFDYFTEVINGKARDSRGDYTASEDDNVLVKGVAGDKNALGYFGLAYLEENKGKIKDVQVDAGKGDGCITPNQQTVEGGKYAPLSRPLFIYVRKNEADKPEVKAFVDFYMTNAAKLSSEVGYVKFPDRIYTMAKARWDARKTGTMYKDAPAGSTIEQLLARP